MSTVFIQPISEDLTSYLSVAAIKQFWDISICRASRSELGFSASMWLVYSTKSALPGPGSNQTIHSNGNGPVSPNSFWWNKRAKQKACKNVTIWQPVCQTGQDMSKICQEYKFLLHVLWKWLAWSKMAGFPRAHWCRRSKPDIILLLCKRVATKCNLSPSLSQDCSLDPLKSIMSSWRPLRAPTTFSHLKKIFLLLPRDFGRSHFSAFLCSLNQWRSEPGFSRQSASLLQQMPILCRWLGVVINASRPI